MSNHTANGELDDYLEGLLHDAGVEIDVATVTVVTSAAPVAAEADLAQADDLALAEPPVQATAAPQVSAPVLSAEAIAADFLAEWTPTRRSARQ